MNPYEYSVKLVEVYDGDTVIVDIDLGFDVWLRRQRVRLSGVDAPEIRTKDASEKTLGHEARDFLRLLLDPITPTTLRLVCEKYDSHEKYGRILGDILIEDPLQPPGMVWRSARDEMLAYGRGRAYDGGKR